MVTARATTIPPKAKSSRSGSGPYAVGLTTETFTDSSRLTYPPHTTGAKPELRTLLTYIRYPVEGVSNSDGEVANAHPAIRGGPFPLVVFGPGYNETPQLYGDLLDSWVRAGYVVAAPVFPLTGPDTPGGPYRADVVNQPADISFVISQLLAQNMAPRALLGGSINSRLIAVAGQSDGAETAMAVAYNTCCQDKRVKAALIFSGAELQITRGSYYPPSSPPLLAIQGTADTINLPAYTNQLFSSAPPPKFMVSLVGADHLGPYTDDSRFEPIVARVSLDFLNSFLPGDPAALGQLRLDATTRTTRLQTS